ncbi:MAG: LOG family protein [Candidatus Shapirobacteria bacterium]
MIDKTSKKIKRITFFGDGDRRCEDKKYYRQAFELAKLLAENGYIVVNGGGPGVMKAATLGAKAGGGKVEIAILDPKNQPANYEGVNKDNYALADKIFMMSSYETRLKKLMNRGDAFVIFSGGTGTISEIGMTWNRAKYEYGHHEPLIFFGKFWRRIVADLIAGLGLEEKEKKVVEMVESPNEVLKLLKRISG